MRLWARAAWQFILFILSPLRHAESVWGWIEMGLLLLAILGISITAIYGAVIEESRWVLTIVTPLLVAIIFFCAGVRLQYRLLQSRFYIKYNSYHEVLLTPPQSKLHKLSINFDLMISNQEKIARGVSKIMLQIELENGEKRELLPMESDNQTKAKISLYLQPHQSETVWLNFVYEYKQKVVSKKLYIFDDKGVWCRVPINVDTMVTMAKKSKPRSGDYLIE